MAETTGIQWASSTWNPWHGCIKVSPGCKNCYMYREKKRYGQDPALVVRSKTKFDDPLKWVRLALRDKTKLPEYCFTCSWSDFFIEQADEWRDEAMAIIALTRDITYHVLTKRIDRAVVYLTDPETPKRIDGKMASIIAGLKSTEGLNLRKPELPLNNLWLGVSVENQEFANERIPLLLSIPAARYFLSCEPLLGPIDLQAIPTGDVLRGPCEDESCCPEPYNSLDWVIAGGESGDGKNDKNTDYPRPSHPDWFRQLRDQCDDDGVAFFFKQHGEWAEVAGEQPTQFFDVASTPLPTHLGSFISLDGHVITKQSDMKPDVGYRLVSRLGTKAAGRLLDGKEHNDMPDKVRIDEMSTTEIL